MTSISNIARHLCSAFMVLGLAGCAGAADSAVNQTSAELKGGNAGSAATHGKSGHVHGKSAAGHGDDDGTTDEAAAGIGGAGDDDKTTDEAAAGAGAAGDGDKGADEGP